jgi:hypothetical protein
MGGPIKKGKVFFFADYQGTRRRRAASTIATVPDAAERSGDLTGLLGDFICSDGSTSPTGCSSPELVTTTEGASVPARAGMVFDPSTDAITASGPDTTTAKAVSTNGQVNVIAVPAAVTNILKFIPLPNTNAGSIANNYIASGSEKFDSDQVDGRVDYNFSDKLHFFGRYTIADFDLSAPGAYGAEAGGPALNGINFAGSSLDRNQSLALGSATRSVPALSRMSALASTVIAFECSRTALAQVRQQKRGFRASIWALRKRAGCQRSTSMAMADLTLVMHW